MEDHDGVVVAPKEKDKPQLKLTSSIDPAIAEQLVEQARTDGVDLVGPRRLARQAHETSVGSTFGGRDGKTPRLRQTQP